MKPPVLPRLLGQGRGFSYIRPLAFGLPILLITFIGLWVYAHGGRWVQTENAYIKADKAQISPRVSGLISTIEVHENQPVKAGDVLFVIEPDNFDIALAEASAARDEAIGKIRAGQARYRQTRKERELARKSLAFAARELKRRKQLVAAKVVSAATLDDYQHKHDIAADTLAIKQQEVEVLRAQIGDPDAPPEHHPHVRAASARLEAAKLDLERTQVRAPIDGIAAHVPVPGTYVSAAKPVMAVIANSGLWVEANFKETQLSYVRPGQRAVLRIDAYPERQWQAKVQSIDPASGAEFALLPPQNASGNWVKVVQRIPLRLALDMPENAPPLRPGMSVRVRIDTKHHRALPGLLRRMFAANGR